MFSMGMLGLFWYIYLYHYHNIPLVFIPLITLPSPYLIRTRYERRRRRWQRGTGWCFQNGFNVATGHVAHRIIR